MSPSTPDQPVTEQPVSDQGEHRPQGPPASQGLSPRQKRLAKQKAAAKAAREAERQNKRETQAKDTKANPATKTGQAAKAADAAKVAKGSQGQGHSNRPGYPQIITPGEPLRLTFAASAERLEQLPEGGQEVAVIGRSNVGKSSLLNALAGRSQGKNELAHTSSAPGRTRLLNAFAHEGGGQLIDLPGYGYAKTSKVEREAWHIRMLDYLATRKQLALVLALVDAKVGPTEDDLRQMAWMRQRNLPVLVIVTKVDKVPKTWRNDQLQAIQQSCEVDLLRPVSSHSGEGIEDLRDHIRGFLVA